MLLLHGYCLHRRIPVQRRPAQDAVGKSEDRLLETAVFSWPTNGEMMPWLDASSDRDDARPRRRRSRAALQRLLDYLRSVPNWTGAMPASISWPIRWATTCAQCASGDAAVRSGEGPLPRIFKNIFLMGADEDNDAFQDPRKACPGCRSSPKRCMSTCTQRPGAHDRRHEQRPARPSQHRSAGAQLVAHKVTLVDCTDVLPRAPSGTPIINTTAAGATR